MHIKEAREAQGLSQDKLSELTGVSHASISEAESGRNWPNPVMLRRLMKVLGPLDLEGLLLIWERRHPGRQHWRSKKGAPHRRRAATKD